MARIHGEFDLTMGSARAHERRLQQTEKGFGKRRASNPTKRVEVNRHRVKKPAANSADGTQVQARILRVAAKLFARNGFHAVSIRDIASECGVSLSTVVNEGRSKQQLLEQILGRSFSGDSGWPKLLADLDHQTLTDRDSFLQAYDLIVTTLVRHAVDHPDTRRLWLRLQLDHPDLFESFSEKYTWPLFRHGFDLLITARNRQLIDADDARLQCFLASVDWILDGFFTSGIHGFDGERIDTSTPEWPGRLVDYLKTYGRQTFART